MVRVKREDLLEALEVVEGVAVGAHVDPDAAYVFLRTVGDKLYVWRQAGKTRFEAALRAEGNLPLVAIPCVDLEGYVKALRGDELELDYREIQGSPSLRIRDAAAMIDISLSKRPAEDYSDDPPPSNAIEVDPVEFCRLLGVWQVADGKLPRASFAGVQLYASRGRLVAAASGRRLTLRAWTDIPDGVYFSHNAEAKRISKILKHINRAYPVRLWVRGSILRIDSPPYRFALEHIGEDHPDYDPLVPRYPRFAVRLPRWFVVEFLEKLAPARDYLRTVIMQFEGRRLSIAAVKGAQRVEEATLDTDTEFTTEPVTVAVDAASLSVAFKFFSGWNVELAQERPGVVYLRDEKCDAFVFAVG